MPPICIITALPAEARPLIAHFGMRTLPHPYFKVHQAEVGYLLQCGVGKLNAAGATAALLQALPDIAAVVNMGIAGSDHPLGETLLASHVQDAAGTQQWFPHLPPVRKLGNTKSVRVLSVDTPADDYRSDTAFDMEAAGVFSAATKVLDGAFIHSIKVVSDNRQSNIEAITASSVSTCMTIAIPVLEQLIKALPFDVLPDNTETEKLSRKLQQDIHYTQTEQHALTQLLHRHNAVLGMLPDISALLPLGSAKAIRHKLNTDINNTNVSY